MIINFWSLKNSFSTIFDLKWGLRIFFLIKNPKIIFAIELKRHIANASIFNIIIGKLYYKKKLCLIILYKVDKSPKIDFYYAILSFDLAICL